MLVLLVEYIIYVYDLNGLAEKRETTKVVSTISASRFTLIFMKQI